MDAWKPRRGIGWRLFGFNLALGASLIAADGPLSPDAALKSFQVDPGLRLDLVAAEPLVVAPCAVAWDERGRMFVVENRGYPTGSPDGKLLGRIALLEDVNQDGRMDKRTDFAVDLSFPNGLLPWNGGLIVTCAPHVLFLKDTDGDGKADQREVWLTGFDDKNTTQLRVSHPLLGPDGWIYLTSGWTGESTVRSPRHPDRTPVKVRSDSRFHPATLELEAIDGRAQFGHTFDDAANRFTCFNRVHIQHVVFSSRHLQRHPEFAFAETIQNVPETLVSDLIGGAHQNPAARIYPISDNVTTADSHAGQFSAACGLLIYRGDNLPPAYYGNAFACDPTGNLVHRDILTPVGATFTSRMANEGREFLASPDNWFRPVNLAVGPDGALYVCDLYRKSIEHPQYLPEEVRKRTDFDSGKDQGRIWRVSAIDSARLRSGARRGQGAQPGDNDFDLTSTGTNTPSEVLIELLAHPNLWHRETATRLLLQRPAPRIGPLLLERLPRFQNANQDFSRFARAAAELGDLRTNRLRSNVLNLLFALMGGRAFESNDKNEITAYFQSLRPILGAQENISGFIYALMRATLDESPTVRATAFRLLDAFPGEGPEVGSEFHYLWASDPNPQVRFRIALFLGKCEYGSTFPALARIARQDGGDRWTRAAVFTGLKGRTQYFFDTLQRQTNGVPAPEFMRELCAFDLHPATAVLALTDPEASARLYGVRQLRGPDDVGWQLAGLAGIIESLRNRSGTNPVPKLVDFMDKPFGDPILWKADKRFLTEDVHGLLSRAKTLMADPQQPVVVRDAAVTVLLHELGSDTLPRALELLRPGESPELQRRVARTLLRLPGPGVVNALLQPERWRQFAPALRVTLLNAFLANPKQVDALLTSIESGQLDGTELSRGQRDQLRKHRDSALRLRAEKLFAAPAGDRMPVYEASKSVLALPRDPARGHQIFRSQCASCHRLDREGIAVGPDIFGVRNQPKEAILLHLLVPNYEIHPDFAAYEIETRDGRTLTGLIAAETPTGVLVRQPAGIEETIRRADMVALRASKLSLMPDGLEKTMSRQDLADLLAYLKGE